MSDHLHQSHPEIAKRLKRADGRLRSVIEMIESRRSCIDIAQQLHAVEKAIAQAKRTLIQDHLDHCLEDVMGALPRAKRAPIDEFKEIAKYLCSRFHLGNRNARSALDWLGFGERRHSHAGHGPGHRHRHGDKGGHGHTHGAIDPTIATTSRGIWAIKWSFVLLAITSILQAIIVAFSGSVALLADTIHNVGDAATAVPLWIAFVFARRKPSARFTYGLGRVEDLAGAAIVAIILFSAIVAGYQAIERLINPREIAFLGWVAAAGVIGFLGNEAVAVLRIRVGREINSAALIADGYHARVDGLTSIAVVLGAVGVWLGFPLADPIVGLLITVMIFGIIWQSARSVFTRMLDGVEPEMLREIEHSAEHVPGISRGRERSWPLDGAPPIRGGRHHHRPQCVRRKRQGGCRVIPQGSKEPHPGVGIAARRNSGRRGLSRQALVDIAHSPLFGDRRPGAVWRGVRRDPRIGSACPIFSFYCPILANLSKPFPRPSKRHRGRRAHATFGKKPCRGDDRRRFHDFTANRRFGPDRPGFLVRAHLEDRLWRALQSRRADRGAPVAALRLEGEG